MGIIMVVEFLFFSKNNLLKLELDTFWAEMSVKWNETLQLNSTFCRNYFQQQLETLVGQPTLMDYISTYQVSFYIHFIRVS